MPNHIELSGMFFLGQTIPRFGHERKSTKATISKSSQFENKAVKVKIIKHINTDNILGFIKILLQYRPVNRQKIVG